MGGEDSAHFFVLALICLAQAVHPTLLGWAIVVTIYAVVSALLLYDFVSDSFAMTRSSHADNAAEIALSAILLGIAARIALHRPKAN
jgi:uncharacterized membrane protein YdcZ (DUF606 family)